MAVDKFVNEKDESLSFDKELDVSLGSQIAAEFTESLYFSPTGIGVEQDASKKDNDLLVSDLMLGKYYDRRYSEGHAGGYKSFNLFAYDSNVHNSSTKVLTCEKEFFANKRLSDQETIKLLVDENTIVESPERYKRKQEGCEEDYGYIACDVASDVYNLFHIDPESSIKFVENKPFKDQRYFLDAEKLKCLGWSERTTWQEGLNETTDWYTSNPDWWVDVSGALLRQP
ncbi:trifunctional UDP-glucose 4,6-dehydratase/UDP-4-keto-6-deoxy-D-glucose 3,5-epimerase/UDP-4-keto-L-rhamnose-reductase RHM1 [Tanacetum coccineum]